ncbi:DUF1573 domain-containing protein [Hugenholtzia roseola]|uniref:DUF1573 domain-containing protein n=1 Tax=Hugenholtzia roseola TaxID=1002 RepID=UPI00042114CC|nr:DUF1573 domain-containing protein [Hugenholtzia roseola]
MKILTFSFALPAASLRNFALLLFCVGLHFSASAQENAIASQNNPKNKLWQHNTDRKALLSFSENNYNFGEIKQGEQVTYTFKYLNKGTLPLVVTNVQTTCGCTVPKWTKEPIAPNEEGEITVKFDSKGKLGIQRKVITIISNAENSKEQLVLMGTVKE